MSANTGPLDNFVRRLWSPGGSHEAELPPSPLVAPVDFIEAYADYADVLEAPRIMHEIVAMQIVATILNRNGVDFYHGALRVLLDLWVILLSLSGFGRSTLVGLPSGVLKAAGLPDLVRLTDWGSDVALRQDLAEHPEGGLFIWGELSQKLKQLNEARYGDSKQWLTDRYDNFELPEAKTYRKTGKVGDTPTISFHAAPRTNILATSSEDWFFPNLEQDDSSGGFLPRFLIVRASGPTKDVATPPPLDQTKQKALADCLVKIKALRGPASIAKIEPLYDEWYSAAKRRFEARPGRAMAMAYFGRHRIHILKLAVIYQAASRQTLEVSEAAWSRAVATARKLEDTIFSLLGTGMNAAGYALTKMEDAFRSAGAAGLAKSQFTRAFQQVPLYEREARLKTLVDAETIKEVRRTTAGRSATVYIHRDWDERVPGK
jgi:hypothetical protein